MASAWLHLARTVARRAERRMTELAAQKGATQAVNPEAIAYINRLSDHLFVLARRLNDNGTSTTCSGCPAAAVELGRGAEDGNRRRGALPFRPGLWFGACPNSQAVAKIGEKRPAPAILCSAP